jgi:peroxiredoxin Q/BCP
MARISVGDPAPNLKLKTYQGERIALADFRGEQAVVLFFYPKDGTPVCTKEACAFRDAYADFTEAGAAVVGISSDSPERHQAFAAEHGIPFVLVTDESEAARKAFGVPKSFALLPGRVTYVIDKAGIVRHIFSGQFAADRHVSEALEVVRELAGSS